MYFFLLLLENMHVYLCNTEKGSMKTTIFYCHCQAVGYSAVAEENNSEMSA